MGVRRLDQTTTMLNGLWRIDISHGDPNTVSVAYEDVPLIAVWGSDFTTLVSMLNEAKKTMEEQ